MRSVSRLLSLACACALLTLPSTKLLAQPTPCTDGMAGEYACSNYDLYAHVPVADFGSSGGNDIWGWTDPQSGREYALMGLRDGTGMVDITDPAVPVVLGKLPTSTEPSVWRDIKVYENYAFVVSEAPGHGMQVFDLTTLRGMSGDNERVLEAELTFHGPDDHALGSAHNIVMNEDSGFAYAVGAEECAGGLYMIDVRDPMNPSYSGCFDEDGYSHDAQCVNYHGPDADYTGHEICIGANEDTITAVDVTDKSNPVMLGKGEYPTPGYTHQGWFTEDHRYFITNDELDEIQGFVSNTRSMVFDLADLDTPELIGIYASENTSADHNMYVLGDRVYQANYTSGLQVLDLSQVADGVLSHAGWFDIYPETDAAQFNGSWSVFPYYASGTIVVSGVEGGLFVVRPSSSESLALSNLDASSSDGSATVTWSPAGSTSAPFTVQMRREGGNYETVGQVGANGPYSLDIATMSPGNHTFRLTQYVGGTIRVSDETSVSVAAPSNFRLSGLMEDADTETGSIALTVAESQDVRIALTDAHGNHVKTIFDGELESNEAHMFRVSGPGLNAGRYTLEIAGATFSETLRIDQ